MPATHAFLRTILSISSPADPEEPVDPETPAATEPARRKPEILRPSTRPHELGLGVGTSIGFTGVGALAALPLHYVYHFRGNGEGPALGGVLDPSSSIGTLTLAVGPALRWDFRPIADVGFYVGPQVAAGYAYHTFSYDIYYDPYDPYDPELPDLGRSSYHGGFVQGAANARLALDDRWFVYARPVQLTLLLTGAGAWLSYDAVIGGGVTF